MDDRTRIKIPIGWVFGLIVTCATIGVSVLEIGKYVGGEDAYGQESRHRIESLEEDMRTLAVIDHRLARLEAAQRVYVPVQERFPDIVPSQHK